jgi:hypothetical protein
MKRLVPGLVAVITCSGCLGSTPTAEPATRPPAVSATPSAAPTARVALTRAQAAKRYLQIVRPYNSALERFETAAHAGRSWTSLRVLAARISSTNAAHIRALRTTPWPPEAREEVTALIAVSVRAGRYWSAAAEAPGPAQFQTAVLRGAKLSGKREATAVRHALGLPPYREP